MSIIGPPGANAVESDNVYYSYDGHKLTKKDYLNNQFAAGQYTEYQFNEYGRVNKIYKPDRNIFFEYKPGKFLGLINPLKNGEGTAASPAEPLPAEQVKDVVMRPEGNLIYTSAQNGSMSKVIDSLGRVTETTKNADGLDDHVSYPNGLNVDMVWDKGLLTKETSKSKAGSILLNTDYSYYPADDPAAGLRNKLKTIKSGTLPETSFEYNVDNGTMKKSKWLNMATNYEYGDSAHPAQPTRATTSSVSGGATPVITEYTYYPDGNVHTVNDGWGTVSFTYDNSGNPLTVTDARNNTTSFSYDIIGRMKSSTNAKGMRTCRWRTKTGMLSDITLPSAGVCPESGPSGGTAPFYHYEYDGMDRLNMVTDPAGEYEAYTYNTKGMVDTYTDRNKLRVTMSYDSILRLTHSESAEGYFIDYQYNNDSNMIKTIKAGAKSLAGMQKGGGSEITNDYDELGRLTHSDTKITVKGAPLLDTAANYSYNANGQLETTDTPWADYSYIYDPATGLLKNMISGDIEYPDMDIEYNYDGLYRQSGRELKYAVKTTRDYNEQGRLWHFSNYAYKNGAYRLIAGFTYEYDGNGNINATQVDGELSVVKPGIYGYEYDELDQLKTADRYDWTSDQYWYDGRGNISKTGDFESGAAIEVYDPKTNRLLKDGKCVYDYDKNGNETLKDCWFNPETKTQNTNPVTYEYHYNWQNRLDEVKVYKGTSYKELSYSVRYGYDGLGRRVWREKLDDAGKRDSLEKYSYNGMNVDTDFDGDNNIKQKYVTDELDSPVAVYISGIYYYYHTNHLGSVIAITDQTGNVVNSYEYDSYGNFKRTCPMMNVSIPVENRKSCIPNRYTYTAREWDEDVQLYFYRARWYDAEIRRFTQEDLASTSIIYIYADNNPIKKYDSFGDTSVNISENNTPCSQILTTAVKSNEYKTLENTNTMLVGNNTMNVREINITINYVNESASDFRTNAASSVKIRGDLSGVILDVNITVYLIDESNRGVANTTTNQKIASTLVHEFVELAGRVSGKSRNKAHNDAKDKATSYLKALVASKTLAGKCVNKKKGVK